MTNNQWPVATWANWSNCGKEKSFEATILICHLFWKEKNDRSLLNGRTFTQLHICRLILRVNLSRKMLRIWRIYHSLIINRETLMLSLAVLITLPRGIFGYHPLSGDDIALFPLCREWIRKSYSLGQDFSILSLERIEHPSSRDEHTVGYNADETNTFLRFGKMSYSCI